MSSKKVVSDVLNHLKGGKVLGAVSDLSRVRPATGSTTLKYRSYNPSLDKADFTSIMSGALFGTAATGKASDIDFEVIKCRDPRYFQFKDYYVLLFNSAKEMAKYQKATELSRINKVRVKFVPLPKNHSSEHVYAHYVQNLRAAFQSHALYNEKNRMKEPFDRDEFDLKALQESIRPIEERSALVWNLPFAMRPHDVADRFWFYDIKHCFKLFWDASTGSTLYYVAFNDADDCLKFKRNFHGVYLEDELHMKLLVETLR